MQFGRKTSFAAGALAALVLGSGTAYAATGGNFILGKANAANATTSLSNPYGTALSLVAKAGTPALRVNTVTKVPNLNADLVDGLDQSQLALAAGNTGRRVANGVLVDYDEDMVTDYAVATATCPAGSRLTGGGGGDFTADGYTISNGPSTTTPNSWEFVVATSTDFSDEIEAYAMCFNPRGAVASNFKPATREDLHAKIQRKLR